MITPDPLNTQSQAIAAPGKKCIEKGKYIHVEVLFKTGRLYCAIPGI